MRRGRRRRRRRKKRIVLKCDEGSNPEVTETRGVSPR